MNRYRYETTLTAAVEVDATSVFDGADALQKLRAHRVRIVTPQGVITEVSTLSVGAATLAETDHERVPDAADPYDCTRYHRPDLRHQDDDGAHPDDMVEPHDCDRCGTTYDEANGDGYCGLCPSCADQD